MSAVRVWEIPAADPAELRNMCAHAVYKAVLESPQGYVVRIGAADKSGVQRGLFHALCDDIGKELGCTPAEIKTAVKQYHYGWDEKKIGNLWYKVLRSTEADNKEQYTALIDAAYRWAAENGI